MEIVGGDQVLPQSTINQVIQILCIMRFSGEGITFIRGIMSTPEGRSMMQNITHAAKKIEERK